MRAARWPERALSAAAGCRAVSSGSPALDHFDILAIGGGAAGLVTAAGAAGLGARAALVEKDRLGGECLWSGCIPSKALLAAARSVREARRGARLGVGVADVHVDAVESPQLIHNRIVYAAKVLDDPKRIYVNPDCGLRTRTWEVAYAKLCNIVEGAEMARQTVS